MERKRLRNQGKGLSFAVEQVTAEHKRVTCIDEGTLKVKLTFVYWTLTLL